ncbi:MAG: zinc-binding dehydrogenase, partial [Prosthecobacter sp.]|nr:zinc-binding dehydrogenase [Prosthecobacter sp.]
AQVTASDDVLIIGAGPIGLTVLEFARAANAAITILELNAARREFVAQHYPGVKVVASLPDAPAFQIVFDATGNPNSMAATLRFARFTGRIVYVGITKEPVLIDDPLFHRRELSLLASRNAQSTDFPRILAMIQSAQINTRPWISHRCEFNALPQKMPEWLLPDSRVIKAVVTLAQ